MNKLKPDQKTKVKHFIQWTHTNEEAALYYLVKANWRVDYATEMYFDNPRMFTQQKPSLDRKKVDKLFSYYCDERDNFGTKRMGPHGIQRLLDDLGYDSVDRRVLLLAWTLKASTQCEFSYEEWLKGMDTLCADTIDVLRQRLDALDLQVDSDKNKFRDLYTFTFTYGKPASQRSLDVETALTYWHILFRDRFPIMTNWEEFLRSDHHGAITRDTWNLLLDFVNVVKPDLTNYDDDGAWPVLIDQFVEYARNKYDLPKPEEKPSESAATYF